MNHRCPECGLAFDEQSQIWQTRHRWAIIVTALGSMWLMYHVNVLRYIPDSESAGGMFIQYFFSILFMVIAFVLLYRYAYLFWKGQFAAVLPHGLFLRLDKPDVEIIAWDNISRVTQKSSPVGAVIFLKKEKLVRDIVGVFRNPDQAQAFVQCVEERIQNSE